MDYGWLDDVFCDENLVAVNPSNDCRNIIDDDDQLFDSMSRKIASNEMMQCGGRGRCSPEPEYISNLLDLLGTNLKDDDSVATSSMTATTTPHSFHYSPFSQIDQSLISETLTPDPSVDNIIEEAYRTFHESWMQGLEVLRCKFVQETAHLRSLNNELCLLKSENISLRIQQSQIQSSGLPQEVLPLLITPSNDVSIADNEEDLDKTFEPQIDKQKLKTKLCKYFMQGKDQSMCPFYHRHGWCAFAHGDQELHSEIPPPPPLVPSPIATSVTVESQPLIMSPVIIPQQSFM